MLERLKNISVVSAMSARPAARASIKGGAEHPKLHGTMSFYPYRNGAIVLAELWGLPYDSAPCAPNVYAIHIHAGGGCSGDFSDAGGHYNPDN